METPETSLGTSIPVNAIFEAKKGQTLIENSKLLSHNQKKLFKPNMALQGSVKESPNQSV